MSRSPFDDFYSLNDPLPRGAFRATFEGDDDCGARFSRGEAEPADSVPMHWTMGRATPPDVVWTTCAYPMIASARVIRLLEEHQFTGWKTYPVTLHDRYGTLHEGYAGLAIAGRCNRIDLSRSSVVVRQYPAGWYPKFRGQFFDLESWDGSDLFMARPDAFGPGNLVRYATARVAQVFRRAKIRHVEARRLSEEEVSADVYTIGLRHLLPADFEQRVADAYALQGVPRPRRRDAPA